MRGSIQRKDKWLGARIDEDDEKAINAWLLANRMTMGMLVRRAVREYMESHPFMEVSNAHHSQKVA